MIEIMIFKIPCIQGNLKFKVVPCISESYTSQYNKDVRQGKINQFNFRNSRAFLFL